MEVKKLNAKMTGKKLRELRGEKTLQEVADDLSISKSALAMYERGERTPRDEMKAKLSEYYDISIEPLFFAD